MPAPAICLQVLFPIVIAGHLMHLAAFLVQSHPEPPFLHVHIFHAHFCEAALTLEKVNRCCLSDGALKCRCRLSM